MFIPVIFIVAVIVRGTYSLKAELVNGTVTITIEDFDKACGGSRSMSMGEPKNMTDIHEVRIDDPSKDTESVIRMVLEHFCPYVGYFPVKESADKEESITIKDTLKSDSFVDDKTTKTTVSTPHRSDTMETSKVILRNNTSEITSTTENILKLTNESDKVITYIKIDFPTYENVTEATVKIETDTTVSTSNDHHIYVDEKPEKLIENTTTTTTLDTPAILNTIKNYTVKSNTSDTEMTETTAGDRSFKITNSSSPDNSTLKILIITELVKSNDTASYIILPTTESTKTTLNNTEVTNKSYFFDKVENSTIITLTTTSLAPEVNIEPTVSKINITTERTLVGNTNKSKHKLGNDYSETESITIVPSTVKMSTATLSTSKTTEEDVVHDKDSISENSTEIIELPVHAVSNTSDYTSVLDVKKSSTRSMSDANNVTSVPTTVKTTNIEDYIYDFEEHADNDTETEKIYYKEHINDELILAVVVTESFQFDPYNSTNSDEKPEDHVKYSEYNSTLAETTESHEETSLTSVVIEDYSTTIEEKKETTTVKQIHKTEEKVAYEHDTRAVDERRKVVVIVFGTVLLILSLIWAVNFLYKRHKGTYVLPQEENNDMELGDNSADNSTK